MLTVGMLMADKANVGQAGIARVAVGLVRVW